MPERTMASAVSRMSCSSILQPKWFQLFQPMGGAASRAVAWAAAGAGRSARAAAAHTKATGRRARGMETPAEAGSGDGTAGGKGGQGGRDGQDGQDGQGGQDGKSS